MKRSLCFALFVLAACTPPVSPQEQARRDAEDVAMVEAAQKQKPPIQPIRPEPITFADIEAHDLFGAGCYLLAGKQEVMVFLGGDVSGAVKVDGEIVVLAADSGSAQLPFGARQKYTGKAFWAEFSVPEGDGTRAGIETVRWPGVLTIYDRFDRPVYLGNGTLECGA